MSSKLAGETVYLCRSNREKLDPERTAAMSGKVPGVMEVKSGGFYRGDAGREILKGDSVKAADRGMSIKGLFRGSENLQETIDQGINRAKPTLDETI